MIRSYSPNDKDRLIELLRLNTPTYFAPSEEAEYLEYLDHDSAHYYLLEEDQQVVGGGGINFMEDGTTARISWDLFHPNSQGKGFGSQLTNFRINKIKETAEVTTIVVRTSQLAHPFYGRFGFATKEIVKDYWAKGFDLYCMELKV